MLYIVPCPINYQVLPLRMSYDLVPPCGQLPRCFSVVAELLVSTGGN